MTDITMCSSENCPIKNKCYRYESKPNKIQSCLNYEYTCNEESGFDNFIKMKGEN